MTVATSRDPRRCTRGQRARPSVPNDKLYATDCEGGVGADTITGTTAADQFHGGAWDDQIRGSGGADLITGGDGNDAPAADVIGTLPPGGPRLRGILVSGGAIWLPTDGSEPYVSSGKS